MPAGPPPDDLLFTGKGSKHASRVPGPYVGALADMPPLPPQGAKRAAAGLADVDLTTEALANVQKERAARALVSILPAGSAQFILHERDSEAFGKLTTREVTDELVATLSGYGVSTLEGMYSMLGRCMTFVSEHYPAAICIVGTPRSF